MAHFCELDENNIVLRVVVIGDDECVNADGIEDEQKGLSYVENLLGKSKWVKTSYNTHANTHRFGGTPFRKNFGQVGFTYDPIRDAFIPPRPFPSWHINEETCIWEAPIPHPENLAFDEYAIWIEQDQKWIINKISN
jgi:hypothetical protein